MGKMQLMNLSEESSLRIVGVSKINRKAVDASLPVVISPKQLFTVDDAKGEILLKMYGGRLVQTEESSKTSSVAAENEILKKKIAELESAVAKKESDILQEVPNAEEQKEVPAVESNKKKGKKD
jgi:hypothetical protein